jgi:hypothetical protein
LQDGIGSSEAATGKNTVHSKGGFGSYAEEAEALVLGVLTGNDA